MGMESNGCPYIELLGSKADKPLDVLGFASPAMPVIPFPVPENQQSQRNKKGVAEAFSLRPDVFLLPSQSTDFNSLECVNPERSSAYGQASHLSNMQIF